MIYRRFAILELGTNSRHEHLPDKMEIANNQFVHITSIDKDNESCSLTLYSDTNFTVNSTQAPSLEDLKSVNHKMERRIEKAAALISTLLNTPRKLRSTLPCFALKAEGELDEKYLKNASKNGLQSSFLENLTLRSYFMTINSTTIRLFNDRYDGVLSLAEVLSTNSSISKYKELIRFFEIAFSSTFHSVQNKIVQSLAQQNLDYSLKEVKSWYELRG